MKFFCLLPALALPLAAEVKVTQEPGRDSVAIDGQPFTTLYHGPDTMKPYLHPLRTAAGKIVTRQYPMATVEGEARDHPHHQGLWFTHGDVNGFDFWANPTAGPKKGRVAVDKITNARDGKYAGVIAFEARWLAADDKPLLKETRTMTFRGDGANRIVDFDATLTALDQPVTFGDTKEGTFAIRMHDNLTEKRKGAVLTSSEGATTMKSVWGKPAPWVDYAGTLDGEPVGIAIFDHPANPKHPTHWHARDYGLFAANIFGEHDFYNDKARSGAMTLEPGKSLRFRYRVVIHPGLTAGAKLGDLYSAWAKSAK